MEVDWSEIINERSEETVTEVSKSQNIRLIDVFFIGPVMIYAGTFKTLPTWVRISLIGLGACTVVYNAKNYLENKNNLKIAKLSQLSVIEKQLEIIKKLVPEDQPEIVKNPIIETKPELNEKVS